MIRHAACNCGQLTVICDGDPARVSVCHCFACQRRTGSVFGSQAWFRQQQISDISGQASEFRRAADSGGSVTYHFCPGCGSTLYWEASLFPDLVAVAVGAFADTDFPRPTHSIWEKRRLRWVTLPEGTDVQRSD